MPISKDGHEIHDGMHVYMTTTNTEWPARLFYENGVLSWNGTVTNFKPEGCYVDVPTVLVAQKENYREYQRYTILSRINECRSEIADLCLAIDELEAELAALDDHNSTS